MVVGTIPAKWHAQEENKSTYIDLETFVESLQHLKMNHSSVYWRSIDQHVEVKVYNI